jgi:hypothetical protein
LQDTFGIRDDNIFRAAGALTGGIGGMHDTCGSLLGASMMFGVTMGRSIKDFGKHKKLGDSTTAAGKLYKWYEREFGSPTCREITKKFGGGVSYDIRVPWQMELAKEAKLMEKCMDLAGKTAAKAAELIWDELKGKGGETLNSKS